MTGTDAQILVEEMIIKQHINRNGFGVSLATFLQLRSVVYVTCLCIQEAKAVYC